MTAPVDDVAQSEALLVAVGFSLILAEPIAGAWDLQAVSPRGLTLIAAVSEKPNLLGTRGAVPKTPAVEPAGNVRPHRRET